MAASKLQRNIYSIPAGTDFLSEFVAALLSGKIVSTFPATGDPLELSSAKIFVPTRRAARALASEIARQYGAGSAILPQILPLGALTESETANLFDRELLSGMSGAADIDAVPDLERRILLTELILQWGDAVRQAIRYVDSDGTIQTDDGELFLVTHAPGQAFFMAGELAGLIDEMIIEGIDPAGLRTLVPDDFDRYWSITLEFLKIALEKWPVHLEQRGQIDRAQRYVHLVDAEIRRFAERPPVEPHIVVGSTGTNAATARLIGAIAGLPNGAIILPGLDHGLDEPSWELLNSAAVRPTRNDSEGLTGHPQAALAKLLARLGIERGGVTPLGQPNQQIAARMEFLSQALRPAETTDTWIDYRANLTEAGIANALQNIMFVEAENERHEALAIAIAMRSVLETPGKTAALITPDRRLARRVRCELERWEIAVEDSGGETLDMRPAGLLAQLALSLAQRADAAAITAFFNHPHARLGYSAQDFQRLAYLAEVGLLRGPTFSWGKADQAIAAARASARDTHAHPAKQTIADDEWLAIKSFIDRLRSALAPLQTLGKEAGVTEWFDAHQQTLAILRASEDGDPAPAGQEYEILERLFFEFMQLPPVAIKLDLAAYDALFGTVARETSIPGAGQTHPRLKILGLLEARLLPADVKILAGLDETIWPPAAQTGAFLNRPMREHLGLSAPERRIGQTAHDFVEAMGASEIIITRLRKREGAPAIPSRFVQRIAALAGPPAWQSCKQRGEALLDLARDIDTPEQVRPVTRPQPKPPLALRPTQLSVTQIETWRRDPYSIYAQKILRLQPLDSAGIEAGAADIGTKLHDAIAAYHQSADASSGLAADQERIIAIAQEQFAELLEEAGFRTFHWPRITKSLRAFAEWDSEERTRAQLVQAEASGRVDIVLADKSVFTLSARADRIEYWHDGTAAIVDYKSGIVPTAKQINAGFAPQMTLEAAMIERGGFNAIAAGTRVSAAIYLKLLGEDGVSPVLVGGGRSKLSLAELSSAHFAGLVALAEQFRDEDTAYLARPYPQFINRFGDYDHLARVKEWLADTSGGDE